ncbi:MaoC family dehydratase N-terminal domain-containing protein [Comamonas suwonensis]|uniref:MaoC family dehydratase N-terminal domain-containing protein n=1 Tax=Comamonas suwonensis TaxID=2606214 RepID=A0A843B628_9BURK|nr:MaoC family dehydratase N-terminal domain-containing protein [Comamonas suwonensis]MBI1626153.1 MaoC family dehydratase N-terminal domain-containing protein [Comamonas suwonensis]
MIDKKWIGFKLPVSELNIDRSRLRFFAKTIGETSSIYTDVEAARAAGYADLPAPPTFLFAAELDSGASDLLLQKLEVPIAKILHGEQSFCYHESACAGDTITVRSIVDDIYDKKNGALEFIVKSSRATNQHDQLVAEMRIVIVVRN